MDHEVQPCLGQKFYQRRQDLQRVGAVAEYNQVVLDQIIVLQGMPTISQSLQFRGGSLAVVKAKVITRFEVEGNRTIRVGLQIHCENFKRDIVVIELVVAHCDVNVEREVISVLQQHPFVDVSGLLVMASQEVDGGERQLVFRA